MSGALYVIEQAEYSGAETAQAPVLRDDPDALVACPPASPTERWLQSLGVKTVALPHRTIRSSGGARLALLSLVRAVRSALDLRGLLRAHPERAIVVGTSLRPSLMASIACLGLRGRRVVWTVTDKLPPAPLNWAALALARVRCDRIVCHSRYIADHVTSHAAGLRGRIEVNPPGVAAGEPAAASGSAPRAVVLGHISPTKRTGLALEIARLVAQEVPEFELEIVGTAQFREEDFELERELHRRAESDPLLEPRVRFAGHDPQAIKRLAAARLLLHCRPDEPFGMVLIEAMAVGVPVVAPASGGPVEIVEHGETGFLFPAGDAAAAAAHVVTLIRDPELARRMGSAAAERARERYSVERQVSASRRLLAEMAE
jgi:glycosyltransferase involved in cell wall biosynthesis